jgi:hypothetical protein
MSGAGWMIVMMLGMVLSWGLVIVGIVWLLRETIGHGHYGPGATVPDLLHDEAQEALVRRFVAIVVGVTDVGPPFEGFLG